MVILTVVIVVLVFVAIVVADALILLLQMSSPNCSIVIKTLSSSIVQMSIKPDFIPGVIWNF
jgi:hypothetical protein